MELRETRHAAARRQRRGIPPSVMNHLLEQGACTWHAGADVFNLYRAARRRTLGDRIHAALEGYLDSYVVLRDDGCVVTAAWRTRLLHRP
jgi:hypothetical protein